MPIASFARIVRSSSEDENHPASNLIKKSSKIKSWLCREKGEDYAEVILQLDKMLQITAIDIGNACSAFVEISVGSTTNDGFKTILPSSSFMTPMESMHLSMCNRVRFFGADQLDENVLRSKWDLIRAVCTQPFNKHIQYGISFIKIHTNSSTGNEAQCSGSKILAEDKSNWVPKMLGRFKIRDPSPSDEFLSTSTTFSRWQNRAFDAQSSEIREVTSSQSSSEKNYGFPPGKDSDRLSLLPHSDDKMPNQDYDQLLEKDIKDVPLEKHIKMIPLKQKTKTNEQSEEKQKTRPKLKKKFSKLLEGVVLVISGIQNPDRADLRRQALCMGAKYEKEWSNSCTHLICAFKNTPKYKEVKGKGRIVTKEWVHECFKKKKRLPWRRFALDKNDSQLPESEEEIEELLHTDFDDSQAQYDVSPPKRLKVFDDSTDDDDESNQHHKNAITNNDLFFGKTFYLHSSLNAVEVIKIKTTIEDLKGEIIDDCENANYLITNVLVSDSKQKEQVRPLWIFECAEMCCLIKLDRYKFICE